ncbi:MAG: ABC transporter ATP-binding protein [Myxococcota bacterium]
MLETRALTKTYRNGVHALRDVSLDVGPGLYGLLGPNGAGKSTLMRTLATLQRPDAGSIRFGSIDVLAEPDELRKQLGYLPQQIGTYPGVTAESLLERFAWLHGNTDRQARRSEVAELLEKVNLTEFRNQLVSTYSGGMLRRFGIALALLGSPRLLIVDEPTAGLDPAERDRFHRVLADVAADAIVVLSTHIVEDVEHLCSRLSIMSEGRIVAEGTPSALRNPLEGRLWTATIPRGEPLPPALHLAARPNGTAAVVRANVSPGTGWVLREPTLQDAYHAALGGELSSAA